MLHYAGFNGFHFVQTPVREHTVRHSQTLEVQTTVFQHSYTAFILRFSTHCLL
jgi:hypothetical protein